MEILFLPIETVRATIVLPKWRYVSSCDYASCGFFLCQRGTLGLPRVGRDGDKFQPTAWDGQLETRGNRVDHVTAQSARRRRGVIISFRRYDRREDGSRRRPDDNNRLRGCLHAGNSEHVRARAQVSVRRVCVRWIDACARNEGAWCYAFITSRLRRVYIGTNHHSSMLYMPFVKKKR